MVANRQSSLVVLMGLEPIATSGSGFDRYVSDTEPTNPQEADEWYDTSKDPVVKYIYDGNSWLEVLTAVDVNTETDVMVDESALNQQITEEIVSGDNYTITINGHGNVTIDGPNDTLSGEGYYLGITNNIDNKGSIDDLSAGQYGYEGYYDAGHAPDPTYSIDINDQNGNTLKSHDVDHDGDDVSVNVGGGISSIDTYGYGRLTNDENHDGYAEFKKDYTLNADGAIFANVYFTEDGADPNITWKGDLTEDSDGQFTPGNWSSGTMTGGPGTYTVHVQTDTWKIRARYLGVTVIEF